MKFKHVLVTLCIVFLPRHVVLAQQYTQITISRSILINTKHLVFFNHWIPILAMNH
jgi:hypothetical protein